MFNSYHIIYSVTVTILSTPLRHLFSRLTRHLVLSKTSLLLILFLLIIISFSSSSSFHHPLPHRFTFSVITVCGVIELQPTSRNLSCPHGDPRFPCDVNILSRYGEQKKGRVGRLFFLPQYTEFG